MNYKIAKEIIEFKARDLEIEQNTYEYEAIEAEALRAVRLKKITEREQLKAFVDHLYFSKRTKITTL